jgi:hypothetical protein
VRSPEQLAADAILEVVQAHYDVRLDDLLGMRRDGNLRRARAVAAGLLYDCIRTWSTTTIAAYLGRARHIESCPQPSGSTSERWIVRWERCDRCRGRGDVDSAGE